MILIATQSLAWRQCRITASLLPTLIYTVPHHYVRKVTRCISRNDDLTSKRGYSRTVVSHYDTLGVTPKASGAQIKAAYYKLSKQFHPDINKSKEAQGQFSNIAEAYEILGNTQTRRQYDREALGSLRMPKRPMDSHFDPKEFRAAKKNPIKYGRTQFYDFDEFYKQHYSSTIGKHNDHKAANERLEKHERELATKQRKNLLIYFSILFLGLVGAHMKMK